MKLRSLPVVLACLFAPLIAVAADGLIAIKSPHSATETMNRFEEITKQKGLRLC